MLNIIKKLRTDNYIEDANVYLEANEYEMNSHSSGLHSSDRYSTFSWDECTLWWIWFRQWTF